MTDTLLDCGHEESEHGPHTSGYGVDRDGKKHCYACCADNDRAAMVKDGKIGLYLTRDADKKWKITNWPGSLAFHPFYVHESKGWGFGREYPIVTARFHGPDGFVWSMRVAGGMECGSARRTKERTRA